MNLGYFFLYYGIIIQIIFCMFIFNPKLEWAILISMFYTSILLIFGIASEINKANVSTFMTTFIESSQVQTVKELLVKITKKPVDDYLKYLILIPSVLNLASIKLITNYDGNKEIHKSRSRLKQLDTAKILICLHIFLLAIVILFGFYMSLEMPMIAIYAFGLLCVVSLVELGSSIFVYVSYDDKKM